MKSLRVRVLIRAWPLSFTSQSTLKAAIGLLSVSVCVSIGVAEEARLF